MSEINESDCEINESDCDGDNSPYYFDEETKKFIYGFIIFLGAISFGAISGMLLMCWAGNTQHLPDLGDSQFALGVSMVLTALAGAAIGTPIGAVITKIIVLVFCRTVDKLCSDKRLSRR